MNNLFTDPKDKKKDKKKKKFKTNNKTKKSTFIVSIHIFALLYTVTQWHTFFP